MNYKTPLFFLFLMLSFSILAQPRPVKKANESFRGGAWVEVAEESEKAYEKVSPKNDKALSLKGSLAYKTAYAYEMIFNFEEALEWYKKAIVLKYNKQKPDMHLRVANIHKQNGDYEKAKEAYNEYLELVPGDKNTETAIAALDKATMLKDNMTRHVVKNEFKISAENMDMATTVGDRRGNVIVFGSTRDAATSTGTDPVLGEPFFNLWQVEMNRGGDWTEPKLLEGDSINTENNEGTVAFDGRFKSMYFTRCPREDKKNLGCQIWVAEKKGRGFDIPKRAPLQPHDSISIGHPCPTEDGLGLIFSGDLPGGKGGKDLWYAEYNKREEVWSDPVNLGPEINTPGDELFPTFAKNGDLIFASNGHPGLGGLDMFRATKQGEGMTFNNPKNLGSPLNSVADDFHLTEMSATTGYFTSNRKGTRKENLTDIWSYELPPNIFDLKVFVNEVGGTSRIEGVTVEVTSEDGTFRGVTNDEGFVYWDKTPDETRYINEEKSYTIKLLPLEGYHSSDDVAQITTVGLQYDQNFIIEMGLLPKTPIVLPEIRYDLGSADLQIIQGEINSKDSLNYVFDLLEEYKGMVLKLVSHTDSRGQAQANEDLAQRRAQSCVDYLVNERGVNPSRLVAQGKGENEPRKIYIFEDGSYALDKPQGDKSFEEVELTEQYINQFKDDKELFERLHQYNRRTEAEVVRMDWTAEEQTQQEGESSPQGE